MRCAAERSESDSGKFGPRRDGSPTDAMEVEGGDSLFDILAAGLAFGRILGKEADTASVLVGDQFAMKVALREFIEEAVRQPGENAGPVARLRFAPAGSTMMEIAENLQGIKDGLVASLPREFGDEADATGVFL